MLARNVYRQCGSKVKDKSFHFFLGICNHLREYKFCLMKHTVCSDNALKSPSYWLFNTEYASQSLAYSQLCAFLPSNHIHTGVQHRHYKLMLLTTLLCSYSHASMHCLLLQTTSSLVLYSLLLLI